MKKKKKDIIWQVIEKPTNNVVAEFFFEEDAFNLVKFQNKNKVWQNNGGIPKFLWTRVWTYKYNKQLIYMDDLNKFMEYMREKCLVLKVLQHKIEIHI